MARLASSIDKLRSHYAIIVVGSGYGGAIAASRLARAGRQVCLLERGKEFQPGEYPDTEAEALREMQIDLPTPVDEGVHLGPRTGLYDFRVNQDMNVFMGCGLGGTSLVNANVALRPEPRVFEDPAWPQALRADVSTGLLEGYRRAEEMLKPLPYPDNFPPLNKLQALEKSSQVFQQVPHVKFYRPPINVTFQDGLNHVAVEQHACTGCGDCVSGCNYGAKNTLIMNYLPDARNAGAELFTEIAVRYLARKDGRWLVHCEPLGLGREQFQAPELVLTADIVILSAGSLGSTEILLRSQAKGLPLSEQLGGRFTSNGDVVAFGYNCDETINGVGLGPRHPQGREVGPCITGIIDLREQPDLAEGMVIEDGSIPGVVAGLLPATLAGAAKLIGQDTDTGVIDFVREQSRELDSLVRGPYHGATRNTQTYLVMAHDDNHGRMRLEDDRLRIDWPGVGQLPVFARINQRLLEATRPLGGTFVENPLWSKLLGQRLITVHPLGGCPMADTAEAGVVDHEGRAFSGAAGTAVHDGLYVCDGALIPRPLGVNPLLTISALAERTCALLAQRHGWTIDYTLPSQPKEVVPPTRAGLRFTETMRGYFAPGVTDDYQRGFDQGKATDSPCEFTLTIIADDLDALLTSPEHPARLLGTVTAPRLSPQPLTVTGGSFQLFITDPDQVATRLMRYTLQLSAQDGAVYYGEGCKRIHDDPGLDLWRDTTTLFITIYQGATAAAPVLGKGMLTIAPKDFARQLTTIQVTNEPSLSQRLQALARFGRFFAGTLFDVYGGIFARETIFNPAAPPRKQRPLRVAIPEVHPFTAPDGVELRLTRYQGGNKGPVILSHGLGVSSLIFAIDTIETNLLEYLFAHGYDVWLLDYRASITLPAASQPAGGDEVATLDYPAAVAKVRAVTGAPTVQMVVHCWGSTTFFMAMLAGLQGVRSAVCSQIATHMVVPLATRIKSGLHLPEFLDKLNIKSLTAYVDTHADWLNRLYDQALKFYPVGEHCNNPVCHRITFMYAPLYQHAQLNAATHDEALHEMFGIANMKAFEHLVTMMRCGKIVDYNGQDIYLPHLERLAIPITFIHGAENECFLPESTAITWQLLSDRNGPDLYRRHVIPGYGHIDCIYGKNAVQDVYPFILSQLEATL